MAFEKDVKNLKLAYIGGGSRGWAWQLMTGLALDSDICGTVNLYDIDYEAAKANEIIGNNIKNVEGCLSKWNYKAIETLDEALKDVDFVIISILPGTFDEMHSDVHTPEKYGVYQSVGDTSGPGGIVRALRTLPMFVEIAEAIERNCPDAWVINYTNPMAMCMNALYKTFPDIKAIGCCHEVFNTQKMLCSALEEICGIKGIKRQQIKTCVTGVNHFTWIYAASYKTIDLYPVYEEFCEKYKDVGYYDPNDKQHWMNSTFADSRRIKMDLFRKYGVIAAAGDRHLAEFCPHDWYLKSPEKVEEWNFRLTTVDWRKKDLAERLEKSKKLVSGELPFELKPNDEEGVLQMKALLGLGDFVTNVNLPNKGQISNLPMGIVVETNASITKDNIEPVFAGDLPDAIVPLVTRNAYAQEITTKAALTCDYDLAFAAFVSDPLMEGVSYDDAKALFNEMLENTKEYLPNWGF